MFYLVCNSKEDRITLLDSLKENKISAVFHYLSLHNSPFYRDKYQGKDLKNSDRFSETLVRLPFFMS